MKAQYEVLRESRSGFDDSLPARVGRPFPARPDSCAYRAFCATGTCAREWEEALDWACIRDGGPDAHVIVTTSHEDEPLAEVIEFAGQSSTSAQDSVQVIHR